MQKELAALDKEFQSLSGEDVRLTAVISQARSKVEDIKVVLKEAQSSGNKPTPALSGLLDLKRKVPSHCLIRRLLC